MATLSREKVIDQWFALVERGAGRDQWVVVTTREYKRLCPKTSQFRAHIN